MKVQFAIRGLLVAIAVFAIGLAVWRSLANHDEDKISNHLRWHDYATGVAIQIGHNGWHHCGTITHGMGVCVVLKHFGKRSKAYNEPESYELSFQIPPNPTVGDRYNFAPVPTSRPGEVHPKNRRFTLLLPGEFTARQVHGDIIGQATLVPKAREPELTIKSLGEDYVVLHLKLDVPIRGSYDLEIDRDYTVLRVLPDG
ncbi:MAG: hypothetical protein ACO1RT_05180 [Planctomycetaceae bacterium]